MSKAFENVVKLRGIDTVYLSEFNVAGNGTTDDRAVIQAAIDATPVGGTLVFDGLPHRINSKLLVNKSINIDFANSTLIINQSSSPANHHINVYSETDIPYGSPANINWAQAVVAGQSTFNVSTSLVAGDYIVLQLGVGTDPHDPNEEHYSRVCRVVSNTGTVLTVDTQVPYDIVGTSNRIYKITSLCANCTFSNLVIDYVNGTVPDTHVLQYWTFNVTWENVRAIKARIVFNPFDSYNLTFRNVSATLVQGGVSSHGRIFTAWQLENSVLENFTSTGTEPTSHIFLESWCRQIQIRNASLTNLDTVSNTNMIQVAGSSYDISFDGVLIDANNTKVVIGSGVDPSFWSMRNLRMIKHPLALLPLSRVQSFCDVEKGINFNASSGTVFARLEVAMQASWTDVSKFLCRGIVRNLWIYVEDKTALTSSFVVNSNNNGANVVSSLVNGQWVSVSSLSLLNGYGVNIPFNNPTYPVKRLSFYTTAGMTPGTKLTAVVEYWPIIGTDAYLFPIETDV